MEQTASVVDHELRSFADDYARLPRTQRRPPTFMQVLERQRDERSYTRMLAYLLDPTAHHGLGDRLLQAFASSAHLELESYETSEIEVVVDYELPNGKMPDLLIKSSSWVVIVENKVDAGEGEGQLTSYVNGVKEDPEFKDLDPSFVFLTPDGHKASEATDFAPLGYAELINTIAREMVGPRDVPPAETVMLLADFLRSVKEDIVEKTGKLSQASMLYLKHNRAIEEAREAFYSETKLLREQCFQEIHKKIQSEDVEKSEWRSENRPEANLYFYRPSWKTEKVHLCFEIWTLPEHLQEGKRKVFVQCLVGKSMSARFVELWDSDPEVRGTRTQPLPRFDSYTPLASKDYEVDLEKDGAFNKTVLSGFDRDFLWLIPHVDRLLKQLESRQGADPA